MSGGMTMANVPKMTREILFKAKRKNWRELPKEEWWIEGYYMPRPNSPGKPSGMKSIQKPFVNIQDLPTRMVSGYGRMVLLGHLNSEKTTGTVITMRDLTCLLLSGITEDLHCITSGDDLIYAKMKKVMRCWETFLITQNYYDRAMV